MIGATRPTRYSRLVRAVGSVLALGTAVAVIGAVAPGAVADTVPPSGTPATVSTDALPTWQIDGIVWDTVTAGDTVYATGSFTEARPPGTKIGDAAALKRANLLAFDIRTGVVTSFNHTLNAQGRRLGISPDGLTLYVGGDFTKVDGKAHQRLAAFAVKTGELKSAFAPTINSSVRAIQATNTAVYFGGNFTTVGGKAHERLAAVRATSGKVYAWKASANRTVNALAMAPGGKRLIVGGAFDMLSGTKKVGIGAISPSAGTQLKWTSRPIPDFVDYSHYSMVTDLFVSGDTVYAANDGESFHYFDGRWAAKAATGDLVWLDNCYGATYSAYVVGQVYYSVGHAHDCTSVGTFTETDPKTYHRAIAETTYATGKDQGKPSKTSHYSAQPVPTQLHWYPTLTAGNISGASQAAWAVTGNHGYVALAGEFLTVNGVKQQGLTRFAVASLAPNKVGPEASDGLVPVLTTPVPGTVRVTYKRTWDQDNKLMTYRILRDGVEVKKGDVNSNFWYLVNLTYNDSGLAAGSTHTYSITVTDPKGNVVQGGTSAPVVVT
jgi:hypothetical protein